MMYTSIWPYETFKKVQVRLQDRDQIGQLICFVASPIHPAERWDPILDLIADVASSVADSVHTQIKCIRADSNPSTGVIHPEIWSQLRNADILVFDTSGQNGNVLIELGVASAIREKVHVIILREINDNERPLFDIQPFRRIEYDISIRGVQKLQRDLYEVMSSALGSLPFIPDGIPSIKYPFDCSLTRFHDNLNLYTPDLCHRRILNDCLEFGAPLTYKHSWMSLGNEVLSNVSVSADMKLVKDEPVLLRNVIPFMGIMVRGQSFWANYGLLFYIRKDGSVVLATPLNSAGAHEDRPLGVINDFDMKQFTHLTVKINDRNLTMMVQSEKFSLTLAELPDVFTRGRVFFIAGHCRVGIRKVRVERK